MRVARHDHQGRENEAASASPRGAEDDAAHSSEALDAADWPPASRSGPPRMQAGASAPPRGPPPTA